ANVERNPAGAQIRSSNSELAGKLRVNSTNVPGAVYEDDILGYQVVVIGPSRLHPLEKSAGHVDEFRVDVTSDSTEAAIRVSKPGTAYRVQDIQNLLAIIE